MCVKKIDSEQYGIVKGWWEKHNFPVVPVEALSRDGFISYADDKPTVACYLYIPDNGSVAWLEWWVRNPEASKEEVSIGFKELVEVAEAVAKSNKVLFLFMSSNNDNLINRMKSFGFNESDKNVTILLKSLGGESCQQ